MLLTIHNLPPDIDYANIKRLIQDLCFVKVILINLQHVDNGSSKVTVSTVDANETAIILRKLNGLEIEGYMLRVELGHDTVTHRSPSPSYEEKRNLFTNYNEYIKQIEPLQAPLPPRISSPSISSILGDTSPEPPHRKRPSPRSPLRSRRSRSRSYHRRFRSRSRSRGYESRRSKRNRSITKSPSGHKQRLKTSRRHRRSWSRNERSQSPECCKKRSRTKSRSPRAKKFRSRSKSRHGDERIGLSKSISRSPPKILRDSYRCRSRNSSSKPSEDEDDELTLNSKVIIHISARNDTEKDSVVSTTSNNKCLIDESLIDTGLNERNIDTEETLTFAKSNCAKTNDEKIRDDFERNTKLILNSYLKKPSTSQEGTTMLNKSNSIGDDKKHNTQADIRHKIHGSNQQFERNIKDHEKNIDQFEDSNTATVYNRNHSKTNVIVTSDVLYHHNRLIEPSRDVTNFKPNQSHPHNFTSLPFEKNIVDHNNLDSAGFQSKNYNFHFMDGPAQFDDRYRRNINNPNNHIIPNMSVRDNFIYRQGRVPFNAHHPFPNMNFSYPPTSNTHKIDRFSNNNGSPRNVTHNCLSPYYTQALRNAGPPPSLMDFNYHEGNSGYHQIPNQFMNFHSNPQTDWHENINIPLSNKAFNNFRNYQSQEHVRSRGPICNQAQYVKENRHLPINKTQQIIGLPKKCVNKKTHVLINNEIYIESKTGEAQNSHVFISNSVVNNASNVDQTSDEPTAQIEATITEEPDNEKKPKIQPKRKSPTFKERKAKEYRKYIAWKANQSDYVVNKTAISTESDDRYFIHLIGASKKLCNTIIQSSPKKRPTINEYYILKDYIADKLNKLIKDKGTSLENSEEVYISFFLDEHKEESHREFMETYYKWCSEVFYINEEDLEIKCEKLQMNPNANGKKKKKRSLNRNNNANKKKKRDKRRNKGSRIGKIRLQNYPKPKNGPKLTGEVNKDELENSEATNQQILQEQRPDSQQTTQSLNLAHGTAIDCQRTELPDGLTDQGV